MGDRAKREVKFFELKLTFRFLNAGRTSGIGLIGVTPTLTVSYLHYYMMQNAE